MFFMRKRKVLFCMGLGFLAAFALWTVVVCTVDVQAIGPLGSSVGLAGMNRFFHEWTGVHFFLYDLTDMLSVVPIALVGGFGLLGLAQWIGRKRIERVDADLIALGVFYIAVLAAFVFFEKFVINYRPVLIEGKLEASYPSSTTMLVLCVMPTAMMQLHGRIKRLGTRRGVLGMMAVFTLLMVLVRLFSGVHWLSDILGGALLSTGLVALYAAAVAGK